MNDLKPSFGYDDLNFYDYIEGQDLFEDIIERYLHLNGVGRKFKMIQGGTEGKKINLKEEFDDLSFKKVGGNFLRVASYILLFPLPLICLAIRASQRGSKKEFVTLNPLKSLDVEKYKSLVERVLKKKAPLDEEKAPITKDEVISSILSELKSMPVTGLSQPYDLIVKCFTEYDEVAPQVMTEWVNHITESVNPISDMQDYTQPLLTLMFLESDECKAKLADSTRLKYIEQIKEFFKSQMEEVMTDYHKNTAVYKGLIAAISLERPRLFIVEDTPEKIDDSEKAKQIQQYLLNRIWNLSQSFWSSSIESIKLHNSLQKEPARVYIQPIVEFIDKQVEIPSMTTVQNLKEKLDKQKELTSYERKIFENCFKIQDKKNKNINFKSIDETLSQSIKEVTTSFAFDYLILKMETTSTSDHSERSISRNEIIREKEGDLYRELKQSRIEFHREKVKIVALENGELKPTFEQYTLAEKKVDWVVGTEGYYSYKFNHLDYACFMQLIMCEANDVLNFKIQPVLKPASVDQ